MFSIHVDIVFILTYSNTLFDNDHNTRKTNQKFAVHGFCYCCMDNEHILHNLARTDIGYSFSKLVSISNQRMYLTIMQNMLPEMCLTRAKANPFKLVHVRRTK